MSTCYCLKSSDSIQKGGKGKDKSEVARMYLDRQSMPKRAEIFHKLCRVMLIGQIVGNVFTFRHMKSSCSAVRSTFNRDCHGSEKPVRVMGTGLPGTGPGCDLATRGKPLPVTRVATGFCSSLSHQLLPIATSILRIPCRCFFPHQFHQLLPQQSPSLDRGIQDLQPCSPRFGPRFGAAV